MSKSPSVNTFVNTHWGKTLENRESGASVAPFPFGWWQLWWPSEIGVFGGISELSAKLQPTVTVGLGPAVAYFGHLLSCIHLLWVPSESEWKIAHSHQAFPVSASWHWSGCVFHSWHCCLPKSSVPTILPFGGELRNVYPYPAVSWRSKSCFFLLPSVLPIDCVWGSPCAHTIVCILGSEDSCLSHRVGPGDRTQNKHL